MSTNRRLRWWNARFRALHTCGSVAEMSMKTPAMEEAPSKTKTTALTKTEPTHSRVPNHLQTLGLEACIIHCTWLTYIAFNLAATRLPVNQYHKQINCEVFAQWKPIQP